MHSPWTSRNQFGNIAGELAASQEREFERIVLPYVRLLWPYAKQSPRRQIFDRAGIDLYVGKPPHFEVVIQCKGFLERDLLADQLRQCRESLKAFATSKYSTGIFILLHNRHRYTREYGASLGAMVEALRGTKATDPRLWNHRNLLIEAFDAMHELVCQALQSKGRTLQREQAQIEPMIAGEALKLVPLSTYELRIDKTHLRSTTDKTVAVDDPLNHLFHPKSRRVSVLLGPAGYGKTTTAIRTLHERRNTSVVIPAARIKGDVSNTHTLFETALDAEDILAGVDDEDRPSWQRMIGPVLTYLTQRPNSGVAFVIDALDESPALETSYGLQHFFNCLAGVIAPVVVTARTEFWYTRRSDFDTSFRDAAEHESTVQTLAIVELKPWTELQIIEAATAYRARLKNNDAIHRITQFITLVRTGAHTKHYGEILETPLFLKLVLDLLTTHAIENVDRVTLVRDWARHKILRDIAAPARLGGRRIPIHKDVSGSDDTIAYSFEAMRTAARLMTTSANGEFRLLPTCSFSRLRLELGLYAPSNPTALALNSLLIPTGTRAADGDQELRFMHRLFQEFFLAEHLHIHPAASADRMPDEIREWLARMRRTT